MTLPRQNPTTNHYGRDVTDHLPAARDVVGVAGFREQDLPVWEAAVEHLHVRSNDVHTAYSYGIASALCDLHPEADRDVVLPAMILHDTGWSMLPPQDVLAAISPTGSNPESVILHEKEGARIAEGVLRDLGFPDERIDQITTIVDGHDSRREALSLNDALVKDSDKLWRLTPHGIDTVMDWFGLTRPQAHVLIGSRVHDHLFTDAARTMARAYAAVAVIDSVPQRTVLG